jgi:chromodomain-helicase-DNA-binding protein 4
MSDSEDELNVDLSQWKTRTVNAAPEPSAPPPGTFASINTPAAAPATANHLDDDDFDIDAIIEGIADDDDNALQSRAPTPSPTTTIPRPRQTVQVVITEDPDFDRDDYTDCTYGANIVRRVLKEITKNQDVYYNAEFVDRHTEQVGTFTTAILILRSSLPSHTITP